MIIDKLTIRKYLKLYDYKSNYTSWTITQVNLFLCDFRIDENIKRSVLEYIKIRKEVKLVNKRRSRANGKNIRGRFLPLPLWADTNVIHTIYEEARALRLNGIDVHVDHIIPIKGKDKYGNHIVCGLHVEHNLQIIDSKLNLIKGCKYDII